MAKIINIAGNCKKRNASYGQTVCVPRSRANPVGVNPAETIFVKIITLFSILQVNLVLHSCLAIICCSFKRTAYRGHRWSSVCSNDQVVMRKREPMVASRSVSVDGETALLIDTDMVKEGMVQENI